MSSSYVSVKIGCDRYNGSEPTVVTIDPGIRGTGLAIWSLKTWKTATVPLATIVITPSSTRDWVEAISDIYEEIDKVWVTYNVQKAYCEFPQYFTAGVGHSATAKGDIHKLACLIGVFMGMMLEKGVTFTPVKVTTWKGQLPKKAVISRLKRREPFLENMNIDSHAWDAVGIGFYLKGKF